MACTNGLNRDADCIDCAPGNYETDPETSCTACVSPCDNCISPTVCESNIISKKNI